MSWKEKFSVGMISLVLLVPVATAGCSVNSNQIGQKRTGEKIHMPVSMATDFANYKEVPVSSTATVKPYVIEPDLSNVTNTEMFQFSNEAERMLIENGFVVIPSQYREFFMLYEVNRYQPVPNFITTDSMLHNYHLYFNHLLRVVEKDKLAPLLNELTAAMLSESEKQYKALKGTDWENAAKRNIGFFTVASKLLNPEIPVSGIVKVEVEEELRLIENRGGIQDSPLMNMGQNVKGTEILREDYSQYIPRGHYDKDELLQSYFKAMMWYGRMTFRLQSDDETKSAILLTLALSSGDNGQKWDQIYQPTNFFVGKADDLSFLEYIVLLEKIYGADVGLEDLTADDGKLLSFKEAASKMEPALINSIPIFDEDIQPDRAKAINGFRFMGQRFTLDAAIFQRLIYRDVKENSEGQRRLLPKVLDIPAAMGSKEAHTILEDEGQTRYDGYQKNMSKLQEYIANQGKEIWTQNLYWGWLYTLNSLLDEKGEGYPSFMQNRNWQRKDLNTFVSSWTELKHDTLLYTKQVYAEMGGGGEDVDDRGYVEPNPVLFARLAALVDMTREGLASRNLLDERDRESLDRMEQLALSLKTIAEKELSNTPLSDEEYDLIRSYGGQLEHFWLEALRDVGVDHPSLIGENPAALVADVATDPNGQVLQEATGHIFEIYAVVPVDGRLRIASGGVYSHYEFPWPLADRLTDKKWHEMLDTGEVPPLSGWTKNYIAQ
ncbi:MAG TPA: DUF3160 domain-containing protein [Bacillus bacterium]|nr:DUF3160 domain-containing protein [Bacillus sp. (in: firmicutes)]